MGKAYNELKQGEPAIERLFSLALFKSEVDFYGVVANFFFFFFLTSSLIYYNTYEKMSSIFLSVLQNRSEYCLW